MTSAAFAQPIWQPAPKRSRDLYRVLALPARTWAEAEIDRVVRDMTALLRTPHGTMTLLPIQAMALYEIMTCRGGFFPICAGGGKCVRAETEVFDPDGGRRRADQIGTGSVFTSDENGNLAHASATFFASGSKQCVDVVLSCGALVGLSLDHPVFASRGWVEAKDLVVGDFVATPARVLSPPETLSISSEDVRLAAYLLADGSLSQRGWAWTNARPSCIDEFLGLWPEVTELQPRSNCRQFNLRGSAGFRSRYPEISGLSTHKRVPASFWRLSNEHVALFLHRFFSCDGYYNRGKGVGVVLASEGLIADLRFLLSRLGIACSTHPKPSRCNGKVFPAWRLSICGADYQRFVEVIGLLWDRPYSPVPKARNTNRDLLPIGIAECGPIAETLGVSVGSVIRALNLRPGGHASRVAFAAFCERTGYQSSLLSGGLSWSRVVSVTPTGAHPVFDLSVPSHGCFFGNGILLHNTLTSLLAPTVLRSERPLLLVPAKLREKTRRAWRELAKHWQIRPNIRIESYQRLGRESCAKFLDGYSPEEIEREIADWRKRLGREKIHASDVIDRQCETLRAKLEAVKGYKPDCVIGDEAHKLRYASAAVSKRVRRYVEKHRPPVVMMSGTMMSRSLNDIEHLGRWALGHGFPLPHDFMELQAWAGVIDERTHESEAHQPDLGALGEVWGTTRTEVRRSFRDRLHSTRGVIATTESGWSGPLVIDRIDPEVPAEIVDGLRKMRATWATPDGNVFEDALSLWRHCRELACGFWLQWSPPGPPDWMLARKEWAQWCRYLCEHNRSGYDSHLQIERAVDNGRFPDARRSLESWRAIKETFEITTVPVWVSDFMIDAVRKQLSTTKEPTLVWCENPCFGVRASSLLGLPYFGQQGLDARGKSILDFSGSSALVSRRAVGEGFDLQHFARNLVCGPMTRGDEFEQLLARTHRMKQTADEVRCDIIFTCDEHERALGQALRDARAQQDTCGQKQKLLLADWAFEIKT